MFVGPGLDILKLPNFFKALHAVDDGRDLSNESRRKASSRAATPKLRPMVSDSVVADRNARERIQTR
jgi:hypothetical protein